MNGQTILTTLLCGVLTSIAPDARGADIFVYDKAARNDPPGSEILLDGSIVIDGTIETGDYEKFIEAVAVAGWRKGHVHITSRGGNVAAALAIGRLIRHLQFSTEVPDNIPGYPTRCWADSFSECTCASACVLVYLGGVERRGTYLAIHRTFVTHDILKELSLADAQELGALQDAAVEQYLEQMGAPPTLLETMRAVPSSDIRVLPRKYVQDYLQTPPETDEWLTARCGDVYQLLERYSATSSTPGTDDDDAARKALDDAYECRTGSLRAARADVFYRVLAEAVKGIDPSKRTSEISRLAARQLFNVADLLGRHWSDVADELRWLGLGFSLLNGTTEMFAMQGIQNNVVYVSVLDDGRVSSIRLVLGSEIRYTGPFTKSVMAGDVTLSWANQHLGSRAGEVQRRKGQAILFATPASRFLLFTGEGDDSVVDITLCSSRAGNSCDYYIETLGKNQR
jgi:hypothetical protein